jgi:uncharacterized protein YoxC
MDTQTILIFILFLLSINLILVGVYIVLVLKDIRKTIRVTNELLEGTRNAVSEFKGSFHNLPFMARTIFEVYKTVKHGKKK